MPTELRGAIEARKALRKFTPELSKELQKEMVALLTGGVRQRLAILNIDNFQDLMQLPLGEA